MTDPITVTLQVDPMAYDVMPRITSLSARLVSPSSATI